jgi:hypothetical protein
MEWYHNGMPTLHRNCNVSEHGRTRGEASPGNSDATFGIFLPFVLLCMHTSNHKNGGVRMGGWRGIDSDGKVFPGLGIIGHNRQIPALIFSWYL